MMTLRPAVRAGLRRLVATPGAWPPADPFIFQNLLLDECSSDARPLVRLVLRAGEIGVPERIRAATSRGQPWEAARAPLVLALVEELFVQSEVAQWVVDTWAIALGVTAALPAPPVASPPVAPRRPAAPATTPRPRAVVPVATRPPVRAAIPLQPLSGPVAGATRRPPAGPTSPGQMVARSPVVWGTVLLAFLAMTAIALRIATRDGRDARVTARIDGPSGVVVAGARAAAPPPVSAAATPGVGALTPRELPGVGEGRRSVLAVTPATRPDMPAGPGATAIVAREVGADGIPGSPTALPRNASAAERRPDRVELRTGRVLTGRVELVRASVIIFQEWESGLRFELAKGDIAQIVTEFGTTVKFTPEGMPANEKRLPLVKRGVGGTYVASYRPLDVRGSPECRAVFGPNMAAERVTVTHIPGADTLTMAFESGKRFATVIDGVGQFATSFAIAEGQARTSTALTTRLEGRFGAEGFDGVTHIIAFRRSATSGGDLSCYAQIATTGVKQLAGVPGR
jgi:hypothetical protein